MHYVYYLLDAVTKDLLYIGRSNKVKTRISAFVRRTGITPVLGVLQRHSDFQKACQAELKAIAKHWPPYNKQLTSSIGFSGGKQTDAAKAKIKAKNLGHIPTTEVREKISKALMGRMPTVGMTGKHLSQEVKDKLRRKVISLETRERMRQSALGRKLSLEAKQKLSKMHQGRVFSEETKARISAGVLAAKQRSKQ